MSTYYTIHDVAHLLQKHPDTIRNWIKKPHDPLPHIRIGRSILIPKADLTAYLNMHRAARVP